MGSVLSLPTQTIPCSSISDGYMIPKASASLSSKNHTTVDVERHVWKSSGPVPLLEQGYLKELVQDCVQMSFEYLQADEMEMEMFSLLECFSFLHAKCYSWTN